VQFDGLENLVMAIHTYTHLVCELNLLQKYFGEGLKHNLKKRVSRSVGYRSMEAKVCGVNGFRDGSVAHTLPRRFDFREVLLSRPNCRQPCSILLEDLSQFQ